MFDSPEGVGHVSTPNAFTLWLLSSLGFDLLCYLVFQPMANRTANMQGWEGKPQQDSVSVSWQPNTVTRDRKQNNPSSFHHTENNEYSWSWPAAASGLSELNTERNGAWWFSTAVWRTKFQSPGNLTYIKILMHGGTWAAGRVEKNVFE